MTPRGVRVDLTVDDVVVAARVAQVQAIKTSPVNKPTTAKVRTTKVLMATEVPGNETAATTIETNRPISRTSRDRAVHGRGDAAGVEAVKAAKAATNRLATSFLKASWSWTKKRCSVVVADLARAGPLAATSWWFPKRPTPPISPSLRAEPSLSTTYPVPTDDVFQIHGNIYLGRVQNVLPGMEAAFVDIGTPKNAVIYRGDVQYAKDDFDGGSSAQPKIEQMLKARQPILCQVTKNPIAHKGAQV